MPNVDIDAVRLAANVDNNREGGHLQDLDSADSLRRLWAVLKEIEMACGDIEECSDQNGLFALIVDNDLSATEQTLWAGKHDEHGSFSWQQILLEAGLGALSFCLSSRFCGPRGEFANGGRGLRVPPKTAGASAPRGTGAGEGCRSFSADTKVLMADGTTKPMGEVKIGDEVLAEDPETGERGIRRVTNLWIHEDTMQGLLVDGRVLTTTEDHPYWNLTDRKWERADELDAGDLLLAPTGVGVPVGGLTSVASLGMAYNLTVDDIHTYYVMAGNTPVLVHNAGGDDPSLGDMKKLSDSQAKKVVGDVHEFKQDVVGRGAKISSYDVYIEKSTGNLYLMDKSGRNPIPTYVNKGGSWHPGAGEPLGGC